MSPVDLGSPALWTLVPVSVLATLATILVFRRWSDRQAIQRTTNRMLAHVMEFRLFVDEPALILRAQRDLFAENWHLLLLLLRPSLILTIPFLVLLGQMDAWYGRAPLPAGEAAIVTAQLRTAHPADLRINAPQGIDVETPGVHVASLNQISWRIRPRVAASGEMQVRGTDATKSIAAGEGFHYLSEKRSSSLAAFLLHLNERRLTDPSIAWIELRYPAARILGLHWLVWFLLVSIATGMAIYGVPAIVSRINAA
jgi:hypothetical protein